MLLSLLVCATFVIPTLCASAQNWQKRSIYQLVTDRFATTDGSAPSCDTSERRYCNGTWKGIINKLDYIQRMGFDAVWISPIVANLEGPTGDGEAYHGYWTVDHNTLNAHFGSESDLKQLSTALHARGMYLMIDVVVNHMAASSIPPNYTAFEPFDQQSDFHPFCWITDYSNQTNVEQCWLGDQNVPLADMDTEDEDIVNFFYSWIQTLVNSYGADGVRIDTVKHVRKDFWPDFAQASGVFSLGEVLDGDIQYVSQYTQVLDSILDYPAFYPLIRAFTNTTGDLSQLASTVEAEQSAYKHGVFMTGAFLENADNPRFQSFQTDQALVMNAMTWPFVGDGIPILYYGQEQGYTGGNDPANREALWLSGYEENKPLVVHVRTLNAARKAAIKANGQFIDTTLKFLSATKSSLAISKSPMLTLLSNGGSTSTPSWNVPDAGYAPNEELIDVVSCMVINANKEGGVSVQGSKGMPQVILPVSIFSKSFCTTLKGDASTSLSSAQGASSAAGPLRKRTPSWQLLVTLLAALLL
ncbi:uncharacterized protein FIBRA_02579 [Fibroporia radiculosa]|uniref:alpha-amylase n=1 Tax=Fibroporia radiculosa TaxID=599839 RepID=J4GMZ6_9APHY|nr:uncharacterized protein FIBRA_02579 [Fibroporia radiculosa]CCM00545.1 predicted protein [Fibroporia radiculosa]